MSELKLRDDYIEGKILLIIGLKSLEKYGILSAYECIKCKLIIDVLRKLCSEGFPTKNIYDIAAQLVLEYEKFEFTNEKFNKEQK